MKYLDYVNIAISLLFFICYSYQFFYIPVSLFIKRKKIESKAVGKNKYAVLISARNEEKVLGNLLADLNGQSYGKENVDVYVIADNCTDSTSDIAKQGGATVYERFDKQNVGKGYALDTLLRKIKDEHSDKKYDAYFVFDADNVLEENFIEEMDKTFSSGYDIVTSYRNSKNYGDNWISAGNALCFLRESRLLNDARMKLGTAATVGGTGFMFSESVLEKCGGWKFFTLTEDLEFSAHNILNGVKCGYCHDAILYDEQPVKFSQSWKQRMRWTKGYLQVAGKYGVMLLKNSGTIGFSCIDVLMAILPAYILTFISLLFNMAAGVASIVEGNGITDTLLSASISFGNMYSAAFLLGAIATVSEWKRIKCSAAKKILYVFTFPIFMMTYVPISVAAVFGKVSWEPIEHTLSISATEVKRRGNRKGKI